MFTLKNPSPGLGLLLAATPLSSAALAEGPKVTVYKSPTCGCCTQWIAHLRKDGFEMKPVDVNDLDIVNRVRGVLS